MASKKPTKQAKPKKAPVRYSEELAEKICGRLAMGESLRSICRSAGMPGESAVRLWATHPDHPFAAQYARAREIGYHRMADELLEIADDATHDYRERAKEDGPGQILVDHDHIARSRLRVEARKWILSKMLPKVYGDKLQVQGDKDNPLHAVLTVDNLLADIDGTSGRIPTHTKASE